MKKPWMENIQSIVDSFPIPYQSMDAKAFIVQVNKAWLELLGYSRKEVINKWFGDFLTPDSANLFRKRFPIFLTERKVHSLEYTLMGKDGRELIVSFDGNIEYDEKNQFKRTHCFLKDITEQKRIRQSLQESEERFRALLTSSPDYILILDSDLIIEFSNRSSPGLTVDELIGKQIYDFVTADKRSEVKGILEKVLKTGEPATYETQYFPPDGSTIHYETKAVRRAIDENAVGLILNSRDITERKQTEHTLRESEKKYRQLIETAEEGVWILDKNDLTQFVNQKIADLFGYRADEIIGKSPEDFMDEQGKKVLREHIKNRHAGNRDQYENKLIRNDGSDLWVIISANPIYDENGKYSGSLGMLTDITERKQTEQQLQKSEEKYRTLFGNMLEGFAYCQMIFDKNNKPIDFVYLDVNAAFERITNTKTIIGKPVTQVYPGIKEAFPQLFEIYGRVALTGKPESFDIEFTPIGKWLHLSVYSTLKETFIATFTDITERKQAEEALQESEEQYRSVVEDSPFLIERFLPDGTITFVNQEYCRFFGKKPDELVGMNMRFSIPEKERESVLSNIASLTEESPVQAFENNNVRHDGEIRWMRWTNRALFDEKGKVTSYQSLSEDITERKQVEQALKESNRKFRNIFENSLVGIYQTSLEGRFISVNIAFAKMLGYDSPEEIMTCITNIGEQLYTNSEERNNLAHLLKEHGKVENFEIQMKKKDGQPIRLLSSPRVVRDEKDNVLFYEGAAIDITERKQAEEKIKSLSKFPDENPNPIMRFSKEGKILYASKSSASLLNKWGKSVGENVPTDWKKEISKSFASGENQEIETLCEGRIFSFNLAFIKEMGYVNAYGRDITGERKAAREIETLLELSKKVSSEPLYNLVNLLASEIVRLIPNAEASSIWFYEEEKEVFIPIAWDGFKDRDMRSLKIQKDFGLTGLIRKSLKPTILNNIPKNKNYKYFDNPNINKSKSVICIPLLFKGNFFGILNADNLTKTDAFTERDMFLLESVANQLAGMIQNARLFDETQKNQQDLRLLSNRLIEVHEEERKKIALDLHDQIGQMLTSLKLSINPKRLSQENEENFNKQLKSAMQSIDEIIDIAEDLSLNLHPSILDDLGIIPTVKWHVGRFEKQSGITVNLAILLEKDVRYSANIEISIFRILQEALTNAARHSGTEEVAVNLNEKGGILHLTIRDIGKGFDVDQKIITHKSIGIASMRERVSLLGGKFRIKSTLGKGTEIKVSIPIADIKK